MPAQYWRDITNYVIDGIGPEVERVLDSQEFKNDPNVPNLPEACMQYAIDKAAANLLDNFPRWTERKYEMIDGEGVSNEIDLNNYSVFDLVPAHHKVTAEIESYYLRDRSKIVDKAILTFAAEEEDKEVDYFVNLIVEEIDKRVASGAFNEADTWWCFRFTAKQVVASALRDAAIEEV